MNGDCDNLDLAMTRINHVSDRPDVSGKITEWCVSSNSFTACGDEFFRFRLLDIET
jgi:hypothetical protein